MPLNQSFFVSDCPLVWMSSKIFYIGVLSIEGKAEHNIYDVKIKKKVTSTSTSFYLSSDDVPPITIGPTDKVIIQFFTETIGGPTLRTLIVESTLNGMELSESQEAGLVTVIHTDNSEWTMHRSKISVDKLPKTKETESVVELTEKLTPWYLSFVSVVIPEEKVPSLRLGS